MKFQGGSKNPYALLGPAPGLIIINNSISDIGGIVVVIMQKDIDASASQITKIEVILVASHNLK